MSDNCIVHYDLRKLTFSSLYANYSNYVSVCPAGSFIRAFRDFAPDFFPQLAGQLLNKSRKVKFYETMLFYI